LRLLAFTTGDFDLTYPSDITVPLMKDMKAQAPKAITDLNAAITKATALSATLARYNLTLTVPQPVKAIDAAPVRKATGAPKQ